MAAAKTCAAISTSSSAIRMSTLGFLQSRAAAIRHRPGFVFSSLGVVEVEDGLNDSWRNCSRSSSLGVACDDRRRRRREEEGLWRRLRATGEGKSEVEDGDGLSSSVKDMERYLDELSIEYDSVWDTKPAWCQPWTIALTGVIGISASWLLLHSIVLTAVVSVLVSAWWFLFLYSYPLAYAQMIAQRRKDQKDGLEDTFGTRQRSN
ncbi:unnamed protein product [Sphagnum jensenii]|uniref:DUF6737 domain-containing protein n=1 Tax=Sphagnum jensenii TaxID=128206 RepID=A0ABP0WIU4_9BRYO